MPTPSCRPLLPPSRLWLLLLLLPHLTATGVEKLCKDLKVDPGDRLVLLLAWKVRSMCPRGWCVCGEGGRAMLALG